MVGACAKLDRIPWDFSPETMKRFAPRRVRHRAGRLGALLPARRLLPSTRRRRRAPRQARGAQAVVLAGGQAQPRAAADGIDVGLLRDAAAATDDHPVRIQGRCPNVQRGMVPRVFGRSYAIEAELEIPDEGAEGAIVANADFIGGFALWVVHVGDQQRRGDVCTSSPSR